MIIGKVTVVSQTRDYICTNVIKFAAICPLKSRCHQLGWLLLFQKSHVARLILFYKIINSLAEVPFEGILVEAYKGTRTKQNKKLREIGHSTSSKVSHFQPKLLVPIYITKNYPSRPWSKPPTHSPHTPPQPKHRHTSNTPPVLTELVKPKHNPRIHSPLLHPCRPEPSTHTFHSLHQLLSSHAPHSSIACPLC